MQVGCLHETSRIKRHCRAQAGSLTVEGEVHPLYPGMNVVGRASEDGERNLQRAEAWTAEYYNVAPGGVTGASCHRQAPAQIFSDARSMPGSFLCMHGDTVPVSFSTS